MSDDASAKVEQASSDTVRRRPVKNGPTDYAKWDKIDYKALGLDSDDEKPARQAERPTPENTEAALVKHKREQEAAKAKLEELKEQQKAAEAQLVELDRQKYWLDRAMMLFGGLMVVLMVLATWWVNQPNQS